jgi:hypothetical protein
VRTRSGIGTITVLPTTTGATTRGSTTDTTLLGCCATAAVGAANVTIAAATGTILFIVRN